MDLIDIFEAVRAMIIKVNDFFSFAADPIKLDFAFSSFFVMENPLTHEPDQEGHEGGEVFFRDQSFYFGNFWVFFSIFFRNFLRKCFGSC
jgi:hypothetical protein